MGKILMGIVLQSQTVGQDGGGLVASRFTVLEKEMILIMLLSGRTGIIKM